MVNFFNTPFATKYRNAEPDYVCPYAPGTICEGGNLRSTPPCGCECPADTILDSTGTTCIPVETKPYEPYLLGIPYLTQKNLLIMLVILVAYKLFTK